MDLRRENEYVLFKKSVGRALGEKNKELEIPTYCWQNLFVTSFYDCSEI